MNGDDTYRVPPDKMEAVAATIEQAATSLQTKISDLDQRLNKIYPVWYGQAPATYAEKFAARINNLLVILADIKKLAAFLRSAAQKARDADKKGQQIGPPKR
jgi:WXG100 family type VII secretion target